MIDARLLSLLFTHLFATRLFVTDSLFFVTDALFARLQFGLQYHAERDRPCIDRPTRRLRRVRKILLQASRQPCKQSLARHAGLARAQQIYYDAFSVRAGDDVDLTSVRAAQIAQQTFDALRLVANRETVLRDNASQSVARRLIHSHNKSVSESSFADAR